MVVGDAPSPSHTSELGNRTGAPSAPRSPKGPGAVAAQSSPSSGHLRRPRAVPRRREPQGHQMAGTDQSGVGGPFKGPGEGEPSEGPGNRGLSEPSDNAVPKRTAKLAAGRGPAPKRKRTKENLNPETSKASGKRQKKENKDGTQMDHYGIPSPGIMECPPPTMRQLTKRARLSDRSCGGPVKAVEWVCTNHPEEQYVINQPSKNFLLDLPALYCTGCKCVNPTGYRWTITMFTVRDVSVDCQIRSQGNYGTCVGHAYLTAMDLARKIQAAYVLGHFVGRPLSILSLFKRFRKVFKMVFGSEAVDNSILDVDRAVIYIAQKYGIKYMTPFFAGFPRPETRNFLRMGDAFHVPADNIELIIRILAAGFPLCSGTSVGRTFALLSGDEIYDAGEAKDDGSHCVVLIGSGVTNYPGNPNKYNKRSVETWPLNPSNQPLGPRIYFRARGSWNVKVHGQSCLDGLGGDFNFWADQLSPDTDIWGFYLVP